MEITVNVENVDLTSIVGERYVLDEDGDRAVEDKTLGQAIAEQVTRNLMKTDDWGGAKEMVRRIREEEIRAAVQAEIAAALTTPVQQTNTWGEATGPATTLRQKIHDMAQSALTRKGDAYGSGKGVVETVVYEQVNQALKKELSAAVKEEKEKVVAAVRAKAADLIATAVKEGVGR